MVTLHKGKFGLEIWIRNYACIFSKITKSGHCA